MFVFVLPRRLRPQVYSDLYPDHGRLAFLFGPDHEIFHLQERFQQGLSSVRYVEPGETFDLYKNLPTLRNQTSVFQRRKLEASRKKKNRSPYDAELQTDQYTIAGAMLKDWAAKKKVDLWWERPEARRPWTLNVGLFGLEHPLPGDGSGAGGQQVFGDEPRRVDPDGEFSRKMLSWAREAGYEVFITRDV